MKKEDFKEFTVDARVAGPTREVQFTTGDVVVTSPALIIKGVSAKDAWQILLILDQGLFSKEELEADAKASDEKLEARARENWAASVEEDERQAKVKAEDPPEPPKKKRKTKAQKKAEEKAALEKAEEEEREADRLAKEASARDDAHEEEDEPEEEEEEEVSPAQAKLDAERLKVKAAVQKSAKKNAKKAKKVGGIDLEQFKSASGLRELVGDFKEAGVEDKDDVITYCTELQGMGLKCLKGVNIERRVANLWAMVA